MPGGARLAGLALAGLMTTALAADAPLPEDALLEFLAEFETADGDWVDPMALEEVPRAESEDEAKGEANVPARTRAEHDDQETR